MRCHNAQIRALLEACGKLLIEIAENGDSKSILTQYLGDIQDHAKTIIEQDGWFDEYTFKIVIERKFSVIVTSWDINRLIEILIERRIIGRTSFALTMSPSYKFDVERVTYLHKANALYTAIFGIEDWITQSNLPIFPLIWEGVDGDSHHGTGYIANLDFKDSPTFVFTNFHIYHEFMKSDNVYADHCIIRQRVKDLEWHVSKRHDMAIACLGGYYQYAPLVTSESYVLQKIVTAGYPVVANSANTDLVFHSGEVNAFIKTTTNSPRMIISNEVSTGNSGGPIISMDGLIIGKVSESLDLQREIIISHRCGVPAFIYNEVIGSFLSRIINEKSELVTSVINNSIGKPHVNADQSDALLSLIRGDFARY